MVRMVLIIMGWLWLSSTCLGFSMSAMSGYYHSSTQLVSSLEERVVHYVKKTVNSARYSAYKLGGTHFDPSKGVYIVDCSNYVDQILQTVSPNAYLSLVNTTGAETPTTQHYYDFFSDLSDNNPYWDKIDHVDKLKAGDVIVFRYKKSRRAATKGHVMVVMDKPVRAANAFLVRVTDSAPTGHSHDTRPPHTSGVGIGTLLLKVNPKTGRPAGYAWREGSCWKNHVHFAMARPVVR